jgi:Rps23 Pro-64 3,4-dihydroxylase Tpa1-like proline 4-hydroxylase
MPKTIEFPTLRAELLETVDLVDPEAIGHDLGDAIKISQEDLDPAKHARMRDTLKSLTDILDDEQITYWLTGDTLLGAFRHGDLIPWSDRIQITVLLDEHERLFWEPVSSKANDANLTVEAGFYPDGDLYDSVTNYIENYLTSDAGNETHSLGSEFETTGVVSTIRRQDACIDVFSRIPIKCGDTNLYSEAFGKTLLAEQDIFPLKTGKLGPYHFYCPSHTKKVLATLNETLQIAEKERQNASTNDTQNGKDVPQLVCDPFGNYAIDNIPIGTFGRFRRIKINGHNYQSASKRTEPRSLRVHLRGDHTVELECADEDPGTIALSDVLASNAVQNHSQASELIEIDASGSGGKHTIRFLSSDLVATSEGPMLASVQVQSSRQQTTPDQENVSRAQVTTETKTAQPGPYARIPDFFTPEELESVLNFALQNEAAFEESSVTTGDEEYRKSKVLCQLGGVKDLFEHRLKATLDQVYSYLLSELPTKFSLETQLTASNEGDFFKIHDDKSSFSTVTRLLTYVFYFHADPKAFTGGDLRLYDYYPGATAGQAHAETYATVTPENNMIVLFPSWVVHEVMPIHCPTGKFADGRFTINGWVRDE